MNLQFRSRLFGRKPITISLALWIFAEEILLIPEVEVAVHGWDIYKFAVKNASYHISCSIFFYLDWCKKAAYKILRVDCLQHEIRGKRERKGGKVKKKRTIPRLFFYYHYWVPKVVRLISVLGDGNGADTGTDPGILTSPFLRLVTLKVTYMIFAL